MRVSVKVEILINKPTDIPYLYLKNSIFAVTNIIYKVAGIYLPVAFLIGGFVPPWGVCNVPPASLYVLVNGKGETVLFCPFIKLLSYGY